MLIKESMGDLFATSDLQNLHSLLSPKDDSSDDDGDRPEGGAFTPGAIGKKKKPAKPSPYEKMAPSNDNGDIWSELEIASSSYSVEDEGKVQPDYDIIYKQAVDSGDMFLGMGGKTPSSASCEDMIVSVKLPGVQMKELDLDIQAELINIRHPKYRLQLHLPHPVHPKQGKAEWNPKSEALKITLRMKREYDFINF